VSDDVELTDSSTSAVVPLKICASAKLDTTPAVPMDILLALHTRNFAGTVRPCFQTEVPSALMG